ncbi:Ion transport domain-containing protein [Hirschfeldia incana]|nr:Ion transport domain-containing protein [Hirschfeldia incana]
MASPSEKDDVPMLPVSDTSSSSSRTRPFTSTIDLFDSSTVVLGNTDPFGTQRRPPLVQMSDPLSSTRSPETRFALPPPSTGGSSDSIGAQGYNCKAAQGPTPRVSSASDSMLDNALYDDAKGWARKVDKKVPRVIYPDSNIVHTWTAFFALSCLCSIFVDPLFFYPIEIYKEERCIKIDWWTTYALVIARSVTDVLYIFNIVLQFRLAYVDLESTVVGAGQLVDDPKKIACHYLRGRFFEDFCIVIPIPQILLLWIIPYQLAPSGANSTKNYLRAAILLQYIPKLHRLFPLLVGQVPKGFRFGSELVKFFINLLTFVLAGHVIGSCWYLFGLQRVNQCLRDACGNSSFECKQLIDCGRENRTEVLYAWKINASANACFEETGFHYGIYWKAVNLTSNHTRWYTRYSYSLFWGFQQISTLAGNQVPSYFFLEVLFTMAIVGLGLLLFALLIGNMQNFLQSLGRRDMEMTQRRRDVEQWMNHRRFPEDIRKRVRNAERLNWDATRGVNEELLFENMPDDLQRDIRRHLFAFLKKVGIFSKMDEKILDAIRKKLKQRIYLEGSMVLRRGDLVKNMVFIVTGKMVSTREDGSRTLLLEGNVCGEELLTWCQKRSSVNPDGTTLRIPSEELYSKRDVCCVKNVEAFSLSVADLEEVVALIPDSRDFYKES